MEWKGKVMDPIMLSQKKTTKKPQKQKTKKTKNKKQKKKTKTKKKRANEVSGISENLFYTYLKGINFCEHKILWTLFLWLKAQKIYILRNLFLRFD